MGFVHKVMQETLDFTKKGLYILCKRVLEAPNSDHADFFRTRVLISKDYYTRTPHVRVSHIILHISCMSLAPKLPSRADTADYPST